MENKHIISPPHLLLVILVILTMLTTTNSTAPPPTTSPPVAPPVLGTTTTTTMQEVNNIVDALIGAGDTSINKWVSILTMSNPSISLTLFIPQQQQVAVVDPFMFPYHVVPQRLTFSELLLLPRNARLPTLLPGKTIAVTDNSPANFSLDATPLTHPDLYSTPSLAVHAVNHLLDYSLFGALPPSPPFLPIGDTIGTPWNSAAAAAAALPNPFLFFFFCFLILQQLGFGVFLARFRFHAYGKRG